MVHCQFGLIVPDPPQSCGISVGGQVRHWQEGQAMFFGEGYDHFGWNDSDEMHAALLRQIRHYELMEILESPECVATGSIRA